VQELFVVRVTMKGQDGDAVPQLCTKSADPVVHDQDAIQVSVVNNTKVFHGSRFKAGYRSFWTRQCSRCNRKLIKLVFGSSFFSTSFA
jgi:hypothetical protein